MLVWMVWGLLVSLYHKPFLKSKFPSAAGRFRSKRASFAYIFQVVVSLS